jgi:hypothetical protein
MPQVHCSLEFLRIKCSPLGAAHATAISQCSLASLAELGEPLVASAKAYPCLVSEIK